MAVTETCRAELFPLPPNVAREFVLWSGEPVHPSVLPYCAPVQGPQPARCVREHQDDELWPWHWDGQGTWWRSCL